MFWVTKFGYLAKTNKADCACVSARNLIASTVCQATHANEFHNLGGSGIRSLKKALLIPIPFETNQEHDEVRPSPT